MANGEGLSSPLLCLPCKCLPHLTLQGNLSLPPNTYFCQMKGSNMVVSCSFRILDREKRVLLACRQPVTPSWYLKFFLPSDSKDLHSLALNYISISCNSTASYRSGTFPSLELKSDLLLQLLEFNFFFPGIITAGTRH